MATNVAYQVAYAMAEHRDISVNAVQIRAEHCTRQDKTRLFGLSCACACMKFLKILTLVYLCRLVQVFWPILSLLTKNCRCQLSYLQFLFASHVCFSWPVKKWQLRLKYSVQTCEHVRFGHLILKKFVWLVYKHVQAYKSLV